MGNSGVGISLVVGPEMQEEDEFVVTSSESAQMDEAFAEPEQGTCARPENGGCRSRGGGPGVWRRLRAGPSGAHIGLTSS